MIEKTKMKGPIDKWIDESEKRGIEKTKIEMILSLSDILPIDIIAEKVKVTEEYVIEILNKNSTDKPTLKKSDAFK